MSAHWVASENLGRTDAYRKDPGLEEALREMNLVLAPHEPPLPSDAPERPTIFVFGLPRSGTTLAHQVLAWGLDVGYVNNLIARFWLAPTLGIRLSRAVVGAERDGSFLSDYGKSSGPSGAHEFAYFWQHWLGIETLQDLLDFSGAPAAVDWAGVGDAVRRMQAAFDAPLLFKTMYAAQFLPGFARAFPQPLFVHVRRNPLDVALSILEARRRYYGDVSAWWATYPPDYPALKDLPFDEQIAGQVVGLTRAYTDQIARIPGELVLEIDYTALCADPTRIVVEVHRRCAELYGSSPDLLHTVPEEFEPKVRSVPADDLEQAVAAALERALRSDRPA